MISPEARATVGKLIYITMLKKNPIDALNRAVDIISDDPLSRESPEQCVAYIKEVLESRTDLTVVGPRTRHSDESLRIYLKAVICAVETNGPKAFSIDLSARFAPHIDQELQVLLQPLIHSNTMEEAFEKVVNEIINAEENFKLLLDSQQLIRFVLRSKVSLSQLVSSKYTEDEVRSFLRNIGLRIESRLTERSKRNE